jgi:excisionase family DNA binding protein
MADFLPDLQIPQPAEVDQLPPLLVTISQAAQLLNLSNDTIRQMEARGELQAVRKGRIVRIVYSSLVEWVNEQTRARRGQHIQAR